MIDRKTGSTLVTGGGGGIGRAIVRALVGRGERVVIAEYDSAAATALAKELGDNALALPLDVTDAAKVDSITATLPPEFLPVHTLVNNAGHDIGGRIRFDLGQADDWDAIIDTNLKGMMRVTRSLLPGMIARDVGDIINITSINAIRLIPDMAPYTASKAGAHAFTDVLRAELAETALRVTEIQPGLTKTGIIIKRYRGDAEAEREYFERFRMALDPSEIANTVLFALDQPPHIQIATLCVLPVNRW
jgi:3-hydroxy acid dehydrogenase / malonic semialdehyde reductase